MTPALILAAYLVGWLALVIWLCRDGKEMERPQP